MRKESANTANDVLAIGPGLAANICRGEQLGVEGAGKARLSETAGSGT
jgi:hypothetical protein